MFHGDFIGTLIWDSLDMGYEIPMNMIWNIYIHPLIWGYESEFDMEYSLEHHALIFMGILKG
jgi:hypothetical protein